MQKIAEQPVWAEVSLYVGVIGGAGYDYLAYTSYLRDKGWGNAGAANFNPGDGQVDTALRQWIRAPLIDCTLSFLIVLIFSAVFVASGKLMLGPAQQIPGDGAFLEHQAQFVTNLHPWLFPLYAVGAFLTMFGTLYGTLEVAPVILRETALACGSDRDNDVASLAQTGDRLVHRGSIHRAGHQLCLSATSRRGKTAGAHRGSETSQSVHRRVCLRGDLSVKPLGRS